MTENYGFVPERKLLLLDILNLCQMLFRRLNFCPLEFWIDSCNSNLHDLSNLEFPDFPTRIEFGNTDMLVIPCHDIQAKKTNCE